MFAWLDGRLVPAERVEPLNGLGCFETIRIHHGAPFRLQSHLGRLEEGLRILKLRGPPRVAMLEPAVRAVVERNGMEEGLVRFTLAPASARATILHALAVPRLLPSVGSRVRVIVARSVTRQTGPLSGAKTTSRDDEERAAAEASRAGAFDAILLNEDGDVAESTARNLFAVHGARLSTPSLDQGALPGVTRAAVLEAARDLGIPLSEGRVRVDDLMTADEVFLTGSGVGVLGVHDADGHEFRPVPGPITARLHSAYTERLEAESRWSRP